MNPNKALWEKGDFTRIAEGMRGSGAAFVASLDVPIPPAPVSTGVAALHSLPKLKLRE